MSVSLSTDPTLPRGKERHIYGPLWEVLSRGFPEHRTPNEYFDVRRLAEDLGNMNPFSVYKWLDMNVVPVDKAKRMIELSEGRLTREDMNPFVWGDHANLASRYLRSKKATVAAPKNLRGKKAAG